MNEEKQQQDLGQTKKCPKCFELIQKSASKCKYCGSDLRNWFIRHKITSVILALFFVVIIFGDDENNNQDNINSTVFINENTLEIKEKDELPTKPKEWQKVVDFTASSNKQSETFHLSGGQQKIVYKTTGGQMSICSIYVMKEGTSLDENGGFPVVMIDDSKSDETMMRKNAGDYYLDLMVANGTCLLELYEFK